MRLIDADEVRNHKYVAMGGDLFLYKEGWNDAIDTIIDETPIVEAIPVVRCKDCKFFDHSDFGKGEECWCKHFVSTDDTTHCHKVIEDDFCAWGERKEDAD